MVRDFLFIGTGSQKPDIYFTGKSKEPRNGHPQKIQNSQEKRPRVGTQPTRGPKARSQPPCRFPGSALCWGRAQREMGTAQGLGQASPWHTPDRKTILRRQKFLTARSRPREGIEKGRAREKGAPEKGRRGFRARAWGARARARGNPWFQRRTR